MKLRTLFISINALSPLSLFAQTSFGTLSDIATTLADGVVTSVGYLLFTVAIVAFLWGMVRFIWAARQGDSGKGMQNGKSFMVWGLIALFVMFSVWGIITYVQNVLGLSGSTTIVIPKVQLLQSTPSPAPSGTPVCYSPNEVRRSDGTCASSICLQQAAGTSCGTISVGVQGVCDSNKRCVPSARTGTAPQICGTYQDWDVANGTCKAKTCDMPGVTGGTVPGVLNSSGHCVAAPTSI